MQNKLQSFNKIIRNSDGFLIMAINRLVINKISKENTLT